MAMINLRKECLYHASQATRTVTRLHSWWMTQREINRCDDELSFAQDVHTLIAHRNFLKRTLVFIEARRWALPLWPIWLFYKGAERIFVKPLADEVVYASKYW